MEGIIRYLFELLHWQHYSAAKKRGFPITTVKIKGLRTAIIDRGGNRYTVYYLWRIWKWNI